MTVDRWQSGQEIRLIRPNWSNVWEMRAKMHIFLCIYFEVSFVFFGFQGPAQDHLFYCFHNEKFNQETSESILTAKFPFIRMGLMLPVQLRDRLWHWGKVGVVDKDKEGLGWVQLQPAPDDLDQLPHSHMVRDQELGLVQHGQLLLPREPLYDAGDLVRVLLADLLHILHTENWNEQSFNFDEFEYLGIK